MAHQGFADHFKQWGNHNEEGVRKKAKKDGLTPTTLDGRIYNDFPGELPSALQPPIAKGAT